MTDVPPDPLRPSARELVRKRAGRSTTPDTGRRHHIGGAPDVVPLHTEDGVTTARTTPWQLADRTMTQLRAQQAATQQEMRQAAAALDFELAARLRDELVAIDAELDARARPSG